MMRKIDLSRTEVLYNGKKGKGVILQQILLAALLYPLLVSTVLFAFWANFWPVLYLFLIVFTINFLIVLLSRRYYIIRLVLLENKLEIEYFLFFRRKRLLLDLVDVRFDFEPLKYERKYFAIYYKKERIILQFPYLDWTDEDFCKKLIEKLDSVTG